MWRTTKDIFLLLLLTLLFATGLKSCIIDAYKIPSGSMAPTLLDGDFLLVNKFIYGVRTPHSFLFISIPSMQFPPFQNVQRGHVLVFEFPGEPNETIVVRNLYLVKRCVGLPGDTVSIVDGTTNVNNMPLEFFPKANTDVNRVVVPKQGMTIAVNSGNFFQWRVFIRREGSETELRDGKVLVDGVESSFYTVRRNYYFVLGDNINGSSDSREWGFVPEELIVGKAMMLYWSKGIDGIRWSRIGSIVK
ncbi:MAG: signal peptidase I [Bacteriovoracaceae bacterium]